VPDLDHSGVALKNYNVKCSARETGWKVRAVDRPFPIAQRGSIRPLVANYLFPINREQDGFGDLDGGLLIRYETAGPLKQSWHILPEEVTASDYNNCRKKQFRIHP
jgi:hypothetical protein